VPVKVIIEASELNREQIIGSVHACIAAGADFAKSSTGFSSGGSTPEIVKTMLEAADGKIKIKPSGGIRNKQTALDYIQAGAARLGVGFASTPAICDSPAHSK
jgi:deoxyribose-phosphate aldolase